MLAVVDCTVALNELCHVLAVRVSPCASLFPGQSGMQHLSAGWRNTSCCRDVLQGFLLLLQQEKLQHFLEAPPAAACPSCVCFGREAGPGVPGDTAAVTEPVLVLVGGTSVYLPFHHLMAVPCHVAGARPVGCQPCLSWQELEINLLLK